MADNDRSTWATPWVQEFRADESSLCSRMADGHRRRKGHELTGYWQYNEPYMRRLIRTCCPDGKEV